MLDFELDGIRIKISGEMEYFEYKDTRNQVRTRFERKVNIRVQFWDCIILGNLQNFSLIKSSLLYFMQGYWKRSGKEASKIDLATEIYRHHPHGDAQTLHFAARQKNKKNFLHISLESNDSIVNEMYLDGQKVLMLDVAIGKALSFLTPMSSTKELIG